MSTAVWPPVPPSQLAVEEAASQARELEWLLDSLRESLRSLKAGLEECAVLLAPTESGSTLVMSSVRSESLKGFVTRSGARIVKGGIKLRLPSLPPPRGLPSYDLNISSAPQAPTFVLEQLTAVRTHINTCLDVVDVSIWTGDGKNANFIAGQLRLLSDNLQEAKHVLRGSLDTQRPWWESPVDEKIFDPPLPANISFHLCISDAALLLEIRTVEPYNTAEDAHSLLSFRDKLAGALGVSRTPAHDEANESFTYRGQQVRVKEKIKVESQDPSLISAMAKLSALEHSVALNLTALDIVMGKDE